ncbi:hypothetical protein D3C84_1160430 [compost metagenome]
MLLTDVQAAGLEVEPLKMLAASIRFDGQQRLKRIADIQHFNVAAIKVCTDVEGRFGHAHSRFLNMTFMAVTLHAGRELGGWENRQTL